MFSPDDDFVFIVQEQHANDPVYRKILESATPRSQTIAIKPHREGPIISALAADTAIPDDEPVVLTYCDFYQHWQYPQFLRAVCGYDGGIAVFKGDHPASFGDTYYAYLRSDQHRELVELREKAPFTSNRCSEPASSGVYYVRSWSLFRRLAEQLLQKGVRCGNEYYISLIYNEMIEEGCSAITFEIDRFICWGTPEDVEQFRFWSEYFSRDCLRLQVPTP